MRGCEEMIRPIIVEASPGAAGVSINGERASEKQQIPRFAAARFSPVRLASTSLLPRNPESKSGPVDCLVEREWRGAETGQLMLTTTNATSEANATHRKKRFKLRTRTCRMGFVIPHVLA
jgi:hypothetical protein